MKRANLELKYKASLYVIYFFVSFVQKIVSFFVMFGNTFGTTHAIIITVKTPQYII